MFLIACVIVLLAMILFGPSELRPSQHRALGITYSVLVGFLVYFFMGSTSWIGDSEMSGYRKAGICLFIAILAGAVVLGAWEMGLSPVGKGTGP
ncbi:MAG: hypothetical protein M2R45_02052 [Verrucomicrobia subdivision 3 bacterium]|nr:hypothetical protein [Limisphaerales bacterium]MCS1414872.1 hypothetical protein [Limisphaerales bacterium]